ncbi:MAG: GxxExxY protein [bacterium]|nr:GxxExxY protein [bacterium]
MIKKKVSDFVYEELSYKIRGCAFEVYNTLGFGHKEKVYQKALCLEFERAKIRYEQEKALPIIYDDKKIGIYRPDFVINDEILIEIKAVPVMPKSHETQLTYYLKGTSYRLGFLINFGAPKIEIRRRVWTPSYQRTSVKNQ